MNAYRQNLSRDRLSVVTDNNNVCKYSSSAPAILFRAVQQYLVVLVVVLVVVKIFVGDNTNTPFSTKKNRRNAKTNYPPDSFQKQTLPALMCNGYTWILC